MSHYSQSKNVRRIAFMGMLLALACAFSFVESVVSAAFLLPPGIRLGLGNIVTMYTLFFLGTKSAFTLAVLKSLFVFIGRGGPTAAFLSLCGGMLSIIVMTALIKLVPKASPVFVSIFGALFHNIGQLLAINLIMKTSYALYWLPVLAISGIIMGCITGILLRLVTPYLKGIDRTF